MGDEAGREPRAVGAKDEPRGTRGDPSGSVGKRTIVEQANAGRPTGPTSRAEPTPSAVGVAAPGISSTGGPLSGGALELQHDMQQSGMTPRREGATRLTDLFGPQVVQTAPTTGRVPAQGEPESSRGPDTGSAPTPASEDARAAATAAKPQLKQRGHAMQYYRLHQPAFLATVQARLLAANLGTGSPQLAWAHDSARFIEELGFALTGPESSELPELLHPSDPWALIDAHRGMDADPTASTGAMTWAPAAGFALAGAVELSVRASLPRMAARYAAGKGTRVASELVASHPMDRVVAVALCADGVVARRPGKAAAVGATPQGHDVQTEGLRLVTSYEWLGSQDPTLWNWIRVQEPANATAEEIALTLWNRTDYAYGLTIIGAHVAIPKEWAREVPGVQIREHVGALEFEVFARSPAEQLAASKLGDGVALTQAHRSNAEPTTQQPARSAPIAPDRVQLIDALDSTTMILDELRAQLTPWGLAYALDSGRAFVVRQRVALPDAEPAHIAAWAPVLTSQHAIVGEAATGMLKAVQLLAEAGLTPTQVSLGDRSHPALKVLYGYATAAGTAQLGESARATLAQAEAEAAMLPVSLIARASGDAGRELGRLQQGAGGDREAAVRARELATDHTQLASETATLQSQVMGTGSPDPVQLEIAGLDAATLGLRARVANLKVGLRALSGAIGAADEGVIAAIANLSAGARMVMTAHHLDMASFALGGVEGTLDMSQPAAVNARYDALPPSATREYGRQFELRETRKAHLALAQESFNEVVKKHHLDGALFKEAEGVLHDAAIRKLLANVAALLAVGVLSGGLAAVAGDFAAGLVGGGRTVTTIGEATGALRTARIVGGVTNVAVDAGANAAAQTALNGNQLGSSFVKNLLTNAAIRAVLHPLHAVLRTWGGLDEEAYALWSKQGAGGKLALAKTTVVSAELVTAAASAYVVHRLGTLARGEKPDEQTMANWAIQGATLMLARLINSRISESLARLQNAGALAGEMVGRMRAQQHLAQVVSDTQHIDRGVAMQLLVNHQQTIQDEITFWRKVATDPEALRTLGLDRAQVTAKIEGAEAQRADTQGQAFNYLPLRFAGLMQEVEGSRLWVGDPEQIAEAIANARAAQLDVSVAPPPADTGQAARVWRVTLDGKALEVRERARPGRVGKSPTAQQEGGEPARPPQRTGGRYGLLDDPTEDIITDPDPTPEIRKLRDDAQKAHPNDVELQCDYIWSQLKGGALRKSLLARGSTDVAVVSGALQEFGIAKATPKAVGEILAYIFDSSGIAFSYENYASWSRLAAGRGRITDARFLVHELAEIGLLKNDGVDFMGRSMKIGSAAHDRWTTETFNPSYMRAHKQALRTEYQFLADQLARITGEAQRLTPEEAAAVVATFDSTGGTQACELMDTADGPTVEKHPAFSSWQHRATEPVELSPESAKRLGVPERTTLGELSRAIREVRLSVVQQGGTADAH